MEVPARNLKGRETTTNIENQENSSKELGHIGN